MALLPPPVGPLYMRLPILDTVSESLGFGVKEFETIFRVSFFPLLLIVLFTMVAPYFLVSIVLGKPVTPAEASPYIIASWLSKNMMALWQNKMTLMIAYTAFTVLLTIIIHASYFVPLQSYASTGKPPRRGFFNLDFGLRHVIFLLSVLLTGAVFAVVNLATVDMSTGFLAEYVQKTLDAETAVFPNIDSLHQIDMEFIVPDEQVSIYKFFPKLALYLSGLIVAYVSLRLFALPLLVASKTKGVSYNSLGVAWRATKGVDVFNMLAIVVILYALLWLCGFGLNTYMPSLLGRFTVYTMTFVQGVTGIYSDSSLTLNDVRPYILALFVVLNMIYQMLVVGITAGLGASLYRRFAVTKT